MKRMTLSEKRIAGRHGVVSEVRILGSEDVHLVLRGFGHTTESCGSVRVSPGQDRVRAVETYLQENGF